MIFIYPALTRYAGRGRARCLVYTAWLAAISLAWPAAEAWAIPISPDIAISASVALDGANSSAATEAATQSGTFSKTVGGITSSSTVASDLSGSDALPLSATLTDLGDNVGINFSASSTGVGSSELFGNYGITLANNSGTDTFKITLGIELNHSVDANGTDAYVEGEIFLSDISTERFFSNLISDITFGDQAGGSADGTTVDTPFDSLGSFGTSLSDTGTVLLDFFLAPGTSLMLTGRNDLSGEAFTTDSSYAGTANSRIFVSAVVNQTTVVPLPASLWLFGAGLLALQAMRRRASH